ncbi:hypothetical protein N0V82_002829 [Gnomoniopsis sp. IMI 355080]|nr:hypothetical protein N0V82_002829 [Gnomoniopsis sp. IMI 355080]
MRKISTARTSRRAPGLKDSDYDHEIALVDHAAEAVTPQRLSPEIPAQIVRTDHALASAQTADSDQTLSKYNTAASTGTAAPSGPLSPQEGHPDARSTAGASVATVSTKAKNSKGSLRKASEYQASKGNVNIPTFEVEGQLDPPAWTNFAHKPSPTNIQTAQVPDPSWEWSWPEWHINKDDGVDDDGFEYSFMFSKKFSWHQPRWYNSFVRRRAWTRQRIKRDSDSNDPHMLSSEYFTVRPSVDTSRSGSKASSRHSRTSMSISSSFDAGDKPAIDTIETLMAVLSRARIDREKIQAVENFLEYGEEELKHLQHRMHDIMAIFVFQASRRVLLTKLNEVYEATQRELKEKDTGRLQRRSNNLKAAIRHADEECRKLEYWSDQKRLVKAGEATTATDKCKGWDASWVDNSGPSMPDRSKCDS